MNERERVNSELLRFLHAEAMDRGCYVSDLGVTIANAAMDLALSSYKLGVDDEKNRKDSAGPRQSDTPTAPAPYGEAFAADDAHKRPTQPPPGGVKRKRSATPPVRR